MKKAIVALSLMLVAAGAWADSYITASAGSLTTGGTQAVAFGSEVSKSLAVEVEYRNFNSNVVSGNGLMLCDAVDPVTGACVAKHGEADAMSVRMYGIGLTAKVAVSDNVYLRGGALYHHADTDTTFAPVRGLAPVSAVDVGFSPVVGIGFTSHGFAVEVTSFGSISPTPEGKSLAAGTSVSYTVKF